MNLTSLAPATFLLDLGTLIIVGGLVSGPTVRFHAANNLVPWVYNIAFAFLGLWLIALSIFAVWFPVSHTKMNQR